MININYNERSWAIDLISYLNQALAQQNINIQRASGEQTINSGKGSLFPDVLLFSDSQGGAILQGWELKMPDTAITDQELIENATEKAKNLGLNSFVIWNVNTAVLYVNEEDEFIANHTWSLNEPIVRETVQQHEDSWRILTDEILTDLDQYFQDGIIKPRTYLETFDEGVVSQVAFTNLGADIESYKKQAQFDGLFLAEVDSWWDQVEAIYPSNSNKWEILVKTNLLNWINKFLFAHILKRTQVPARAINDLTSESAFEDFTTLFNQISSKCDFWNIFKESLGETYLSGESKRFLLEFNSLLEDLDLRRLNNTLLQKILQSSIYEAKRKAAGQYTTPDTLSDLLSRLVLLNANLNCHDPFCGTGTIAKASYDYKVSRGLSKKDALSSVWASDKYAFPIQLATIAMSDPANLGNVLKVFQKDIIELDVGTNITYYNPNNGDEIVEEYSKPDYILSNLPFIQFEDIYRENEAVVERINDRIEAVSGERVDLSGKSDLFAYLPFYLWTITKNEGRLGLIFSNAWLGTDWGKTFRDNLRRYFNIEKIITSAKGRWFNNADVVTNTVILNKRYEVDSYTDDESITFISLNKSLEEIENESKVDVIASRILLETEDHDLFNINCYSNNEISELEDLGIISWNTFFTDVNWLSEISGSLVHANSLFNIGRGERRGWDTMFYPQGNHQIEDEYLERCLKDSNNVDGLIANTDVDAFCCSRTVEELRKRGDTGALRWIERFSNETNTVGEPLPEVLKKANQYWYEMTPDTLADIVGLINYDRRLFFARMEQKSFVNQRLIRFTRKEDDLNIDVVHALMNCSLGLFYLEAIGFGRGLGALDLNSTKIKNNLHILNPEVLNGEQVHQIINAFQPLLEREILPIQEELNMKDRINLDTTVLNAFGIREYYKSIRESLENLHQIRMSVKD